MKRIKILAGLLFCLILTGGIVSCSSKKKSDNTEAAETKEAFTSTLTAADTATVMNMADRCMKLLKENNAEEALQMLFTMDENGKPVPLSDEQKQKLNSRFKLFPVLEYELVNFSFTSEENNDMKYKIIFDKSSEAPSTIGFMFNPIKIDGEWHLMLKEGNQQIAK